MIVIVDIEKAKATRIETHGATRQDRGRNGALLGRVNMDREKLDNRALGHVLCSPVVSPNQ